MAVAGLLAAVRVFVDDAIGGTKRGLNCGVWRIEVVR